MSDIKNIILQVLLFLSVIINSIQIIRIRKYKSNMKEVHVKSPVQGDVKVHEIEQDLFEGVVMRIMSLSFEGTSLSNVGEKIIKELQDYHSVDFVTLLIKTKDGWYSVLSSNRKKERLRNLEKYYNEKIKNSAEDTTDILEIPNRENQKNFLTKQNIEFSYLKLLEKNNELIGAVVLEHKDSNTLKWGEEETLTYTKVLDATGLVLAHLLEVSEIVNRVSKDQLTGVYNRRYIDMTLEEEYKKHKNLGRLFHVIMLDIDYFKKFNDTYGHQFGDKVLQDVSKEIKDNLGKHSWLARYGGEEFLIFIANSTEQKVYTKVDKLREQLECLELEHEGEKAKVTASFGISSSLNTSNYEEIISRADKALYKAKENGRNRVEIYKEGL